MSHDRKKFNNTGNSKASKLSDKYKIFTPEEDSPRDEVQEDKTPVPDYEIKMVLYGDADAKRQLLSTYIGKDEKHGINLKPWEHKDVDLYGASVRLQIWETRNTENKYYRGQGAILLVFNVADMKSFEAINDKLLKQAKYDLRGEGYPIILVGNIDDSKQKRNVSYKEARELADSYGIPYIETNTGKTTNVNEVFTLAATLALDKIDPDLRLKAFKEAYKKEYDSAFFTNPFSSMKKRIANDQESDQKVTMAEIEKYAEEHPESRTAIVLNKMKM